MVRRHIVFSDALSQMMGHALCHAPGIYKYESRAVLLDQRHQPVVDLVPHFVRSYRAQRHGRNFDRHIELALVSDVDDYWIRAITSGEKVCNLFNRFLRR